MSEALEIASVTVWTGGEEKVFDAERLLSPTGATELRDAAASGPAWLDLNLATDVEQWMEPWDELETDRTGWDAVSVVATAVGLELPLAGGAPCEDLVLRHLPLINEYGVLRRLTERVSPAADTRPPVMPLVGLIPADTLDRVDGAEAVDGLEFVLLRVNLAVVGDCLVTIRLTDRLCTGSRPCSAGVRRPAADFYESPNLSLFNRFSLPDEVPTAAHMADALAGYLAATCSTVAERARGRMRRIERDLMATSPQDDGTSIATCHAKLMTIRAMLEPIDDELLRLMQRLSDPRAADPALERARQRYADARCQLDGVEAEIRWASDAARHQLDMARMSQERCEAQRARAAEESSVKRQKSLERVIAGLGTALVIAALVPSLFGESVKLPHPKPVWAFVGMLLIMLGISGVVFCGLLAMFNGRSRSGRTTPGPWAQRCWSALSRAPHRAALLAFVAGVVVLVLFG